MIKHLEGRTAVVTGAGRGIGREIALLLAREGANVVVNDLGVSRGGEATAERPADNVVAEIRAAGGTAIANFNSVADHKQAAEIIESCVSAFGKMDILVNVAGFLRERMIWNMTEDEFDSVVNVHLKGHWNMCHHAIRHMKEKGYGRILNFTSSAFKGSVGQSNYAAAKGGVISLSRSIAREVWKYGITCNVICPSADTRMTLTEAVKANRDRKLASGVMSQEEYDRFTQPRGPEHVAPVIAYLCTDEAGWINGEIFHVEKGDIHNFYYGETMRQITKEDGALFTVDELIEKIPSMLEGVPRIAPMQE